MQNQDEFGLLAGNTSSFKDFMGGGATVDLLQFLGQSSGPTENFQNQIQENLLLKQQVQQLQSQVFEIQQENNSLKQQISQMQFNQTQNNVSINFEAQIQELFEANQIYENQIQSLKQQVALNSGNDNQLEQELTYLLQVQPTEITPQVTNLINQVTYMSQKHEKDEAEIIFFKTQASRQLQVFKENIIILRKNVEQLTGWRINILNDYQVQIIKINEKNLYFNIDKGKITGSSVDQRAFQNEGSIPRILARCILGQ